MFVPLLKIGQINTDVYFQKSNLKVQINQIKT
jgi:hypothetical protein